MKRDMGLIRKLLILMEADEGKFFPLEEYSKEIVYRHLQLMGKAGLIDVSFVTPQGSLYPTHAINPELTWEGHEFLSAVRNETVWGTVTEVVKSKGGSIPFEVLKALAIEISKGLFLGG